MKTKTEKDFVKWISSAIVFYKPYLDINLQNIEIEKSETYYLSITCSYPYLQPTITYSSKSFSDFKEGKLKRNAILHELCHMITDPLYSKSIQRFVSKDEIEDERELLTDKIAVILNNLIKV